jgi:mitogen-activated protein kinase 15
VQCDFGLARSVAELGEDGSKDAAVLTDYVATRWYRAPEILLSSTRYTKGVDAWSVGAILGEMLLGQPLFPGKSTVHQLELVLEVTGRPNKLDMKAIKSKHTATMLESIAVKPQRSLQSMFPTAPADALDLLGKLLVFNPDRRLSIEDAIRHPYLSQFHNPADEPTLNAPIHISIDDNKRYKISEYRKYLYRKIVERKKQLRAKRAEAQARAAAAASGGGGDMAQYGQSAAGGSAQRPTGSGTGARPAPGASSNATGYVVPQGASQNFYAQQHQQQQYSQHPQQQQQQQQYPRASSSGYQQQQQPQRTAGGGGSAGGHHYNVPPNVAAQNQLTSSSAYGGGAAAAAAGARKPGMR